MIKLQLPLKKEDIAGLRAGDVIISVGGKSIANASELTRAVARLKPNAKPEIVVLRNGEEMKLKVKLGERSAHTGGKSAAGGETSDLGVSVKTLTPEDARALRLDSNIKGLVIVDVKSGSPAAEAGLRSGDVILSANLKPVTSAGDLGEVLRGEGKKRGALMLQINRRGDTFFTTVDLAKKK